MKKAIFLSLLIASTLLLGLPSVSAPGATPPPTYYSVPANETFIIPIKMRFDDPDNPGYFTAVFYWDNDENDSNAPYVNFTYEGFKARFTDGTNFSGPITDGIVKGVAPGYSAGYYRYAVIILGSYAGGEGYDGEFWLNITMRAAGILNGSYIPHFGWDQKITITKVRCKEITEASFGPLALTIHITPRIMSSDQTGTPKEVFNNTLGEEVYVKGYGFSNSTTGINTRLYVVENTMWSDNQIIGPDVRGAYSMAGVDPTGNLTLTNLGLLPVGEYDIVADPSIDGFYNATTDTVDDLMASPGVVVPGHDVAITSVNASFPLERLAIVTEAYPTWTIDVVVTIKNKGTYIESFTVEALYGNAAANYTLGTRPAALVPGANATLTFKWNLAGLDFLNYTLSANASLVNDFNPTDNYFVDGTVEVKPVGDVNGDGSVFMVDLYSFGESWYKIVGYPQYNPQCDFNGNGFVNIFDLVMLGKNWRKGPLD